MCASLPIIAVCRIGAVRVEDVQGFEPVRPHHEHACAQRDDPERQAPSPQPGVSKLRNSKVQCNTEAVGHTQVTLGYSCALT